MTGAGRALAAAALLAVSAHAAARPAAAESALSIRVATPVFVGSELVVEVRQGADLAGRPIALQLAVDGIAVARFEATGGVTELRAPAPATAGPHEILVKSGSRRAVQSIRVWPRSTLPLAGALAAAIALALLAGFRRRRSAAAPSAS